MFEQYKDLRVTKAKKNQGKEESHSIEYTASGN